MHTRDCPVLSVEKLTLDLSGRRILSDLNITVARGEFLGLVGPNGGGKTSLLRVLLGIIPPTSGRIRWSDLACGAPRIGYVPQRAGLDKDYPLSSREIVKQGVPGALPLFGATRRKLNQQADELLDRVGLVDRAEARFVNLSAGQQRRLLLARALINNPNVLLLDEPTAGVDAQGQKQFCDILRGLSGQGITVILVSHDIPLITARADRIACLCVGLHWHGAARALDQKTVLAHPPSLEISTMRPFSPAKQIAPPRILVLLTGFLGAGKTTLLQNVVTELLRREFVPRVILNDYENADVDATSVRRLTLNVKAVSGSCVCCDSRDTLLDLLGEIPRGARNIVVVEMLCLVLLAQPHLRALAYNPGQTTQPGSNSPEVPLHEASREITLEKRYLNLPVKNGGAKREMTVTIDGQSPQHLEIELADARPDWWAFMDIAPFHGRKATIKVDKLPENLAGLNAIDQSDEIKDADSLYHEMLRPQFHFSARRGWLNDPNGLVFYQGEHHLFFQHTPYGWDSGVKYWGHAVSRDLVHWRELPEALYPDEHGPMWSGSAVVDWFNTAGFQTGREKALVCIFTAAGSPFTQGIAYSNDRGRTWTKYAKNPVLPHVTAEDRDPKVIWYAPEKKWVMALYLDGSDYGLFSSRDLKQWERMSTISIPGTSECPEFFEIPLDGDKQNTRWVFYGGNGRYLVGRFDGKTFVPEAGPYPMHHGNCWYASQTFTDIPPKDGRRILIPWGQMNLPGMPFNQMMGLPVSLTLRTTEEGPRLLAYPVKEYTSLRARSHNITPQPLKPGENRLAAVKGELLDIEADLACGDAAEIGFNLRGVNINYDVKKQELSCLDKKAPLKPLDGSIRLRLMVDRASVDIFGNEGRLYMPMGVIVAPDNLGLAIYARGGTAGFRSLRVYELKSAWTR